MSLLNRARRRQGRLPWERYWVERGGTYEADADGFTVEPGTIHPLLARRNSDITRLDALDDVRCVLALGDPSLGKSWEIDAYVERLAARCDPTTTASVAPPLVLLGFDLSEFDTRDALQTAVFGTPAFTTWKTDETSLLYLVLDSLDEYRGRLVPLCEYLLDQLTGMPLDRLRLRIACRTAVLPREFQIGLTALFTTAVPGEVPSGPSSGSGDDESVTAEPTAAATIQPETGGVAPVPRRRAIVAVEIVPLTRKDAHVTAERQLGTGAEATAFVAAVDAADAGHFAARPHTLLALIQRFRAGTSLTASQQDLFRHLIEHLCNPTPVIPRGDDSRPARTTGPERVRVAARICAAQLFGNRPSIALSPDDLMDVALLDLRDLVGEEPLGTSMCRVDETALREAVNTALFTGRGEAQLAPHQAFSEFLAASWLTDRDVPLAQLEPLLVDPLDPQRKVVPQLRQVAAWLAAMRTDVFDAVVRREPEIVLWSDMVQVPIARRPALVDALLTAATHNRLDLPERSITDRLARLVHPALAMQLRRVVTNRRLPLRVRDLALDMGRACRVEDIAGEAADIALNPAEPFELRIEAARLVAAVGTDRDRRRLIPLATEAIAEDVGDDLKGSALRACQHLLEPEPLFVALAMPKRTNWGGSYMLALTEIARRIGPQHVDAACAWLQRGVQLSSVIDSLIQRVVRLGLDRLDDLHVRAALATFFWAHASGHHPFLDPNDRDTSDLRSVLRTSAERRRAFFAAIVEATPPGNHGLFWLDRDLPDALLSEDVPWMLDQLAALPCGTAARTGWRDVLLHRLDFTSREHVVAALAHRTDPDIVELTGSLVARCATVEDVLETVRRERAVQAQRLAAAHGISSRRPRALPPHGPLQSLEARLTSAVDSGTPEDEQWPKVVAELCRATDGSEVYGLPSVKQIIGLHDVTHLAGLIDSAERHLFHAEVPDDPFPEGRVTWSVVFGFFAGAMLYEHAPERLWELGDTAWAKWARSFAGYHAVDEEEQIHRALLEMCLAMAPVETVTESQRALDRFLTAESGWLPQSLFETAMRVDELADAFGDRLASGAYQNTRAFELLGRLLDARPEIGGRCAHTILRARSHRGPRSADDRRVDALANLLLHAPALTWGLLKRRLWANDDLARKVLLRAAASQEFPKDALAQLSDDQVGALYVLVDRLFPHETDVWHSGVYSPTARDAIAHWRHALPFVLEQRRRDSAVNALLRAAEADPSRDYRVRMWLRASAALRSDRWHGVHPRDLVTLTANRHLRLVESGAQLLDLIDESLARLQEELQGQWRSVVGLWDERSSGRHVPKQEAHLANELARHLKRDLSDRGVVIGRELILQVKIEDAAAGLRTDIDVTATALDATRRPTEQLRVVIEVKGSWHADVMTALEDQLVRRYMVPHDIRHGVYVVGDYTCASWAHSRSKQRSARLGGRTELAKALKQQAAATTNEMREIRAMVLDVALPDRPRRSPRPGSQRRPRRRK